MSPSSASRLPPVRVLGIDPGLNRTGYAVLEQTGRQLRLCEGGVIRSSPKLPLAQRVCEIATGVREVLDEFSPAVMAIEQIFSHVRNPKTAILMAHARGVILLAAAERLLPVVHYPATRVKQLVTGSGKADKQQVQRAVQHELRLTAALEPDDVADAAAIAICHCCHIRHTRIELARPWTADAAIQDTGDDPA